MDTRRDVFQAISDPTRRRIIELLAKQPMNLNAIAENFEVTRPAISNHIKILEECGIIHVEQKGRERYCSIHSKELKQISEWISQFKTLWENRLDSFEQYVNQLHAKKTKHGKRK